MKKWLIFFGILIFAALPLIAAECGDNICDVDEAAESCPADCDVSAGQICGDGQCSGLENLTSCPEDCPDEEICGNGICEEGEDSESCPQDCIGQQNILCTNLCRDGNCQQEDCQGQEGCPCWEDEEICPQDCSVVVGDEFSGKSFFGTYFWIGLSVLGAAFFIFIGFKILKWLFWVLALIMVALAIIFWFVL